MNLSLKMGYDDVYTSNSQIARVITENWVGINSFCPRCGNDNLVRYENNKPVADFYCKNCNEDFELKSKNGVLGKKITDGAYNSMISRITSNQNPNFFFLTYSKASLTVKNFITIPKHFFSPDIIEKRKPLSSSAKRAGWIGCNIDLSSVPAAGRIFLIKDSVITKKKDVIAQFDSTLFLRNSTIEARGWTLDILKCIDRLQKNEFKLDDIYRFETELQKKHPHNHFIKPKIRQQLQVLRDRGIITFVSKGKYIKLNA